MKKEAVGTLSPTSRQKWRQWLQKHHNKKQSVWVVYYKKKSRRPTITWSETVDEALCFGWIDGKAIPIDEEKYARFFCKRKARSMWSKVNKEKVRKLIEDGSMTRAGFESIEMAKQNGSWTILDSVETLLIPKDLEKAFKTKPGSKQFFVSVSKSSKKAILQWLVLAKLPETRRKRIIEIAELAAQGLKPKQFR